MAKHQYGKRIEKRAATKAGTISLDVKRGMLWAGTELVKNSQTAGRDVKRVGKLVRRDVVRGGKRIGKATRDSMTQASARIKARRRAKATKA